MADLIVDHWDQTHPRWDELERIAAAVGQSEWFAVRFPWHRSSHVLVALQNGILCGFLRFTIQVIGEEDDCEPIFLDGELLIEGKVLAFAVIEEFRRRGIGRALQVHALEYAARLHCYQMRSHSGGEHAENHQLKLWMGFGVFPIIRGSDHKGVYFVMPLRRTPQK